MSLMWLDWLLVAIVALSALISLKRGFVKESLSLLIWFAAFVIALVFHHQAALHLEPYIESPSLRKSAAVLLLFISSLLLGSLLLFIIHKLIAVTGLSGLDRLLGVVFGALRGVIVVVLLLMLAQLILPVTEEQWWQRSVLVPHFLLLEDWVRAVSDEIRRLILPLLGLLSEPEIIQS